MYCKSKQMLMVMAQMHLTKIWYRICMQYTVLQNDPVIKYIAPHYNTLIIVHIIVII
jgi:hypothetical protein